MEFFAYRKISDDEISDTIEKIHSKDICYVIPETSKRTRPTAVTKNGTTFYIVTQIEQIIEGLEKFESFKSVDRGRSVNPINVTYYDESLERVAYEHSASQTTYMVVARKYTLLLKEFLNKLGIEIRK